MRSDRYKHMDYQSVELLAALSGRSVTKLERRWREEIEAKVLPPKTTLQAALNKLPAPWIDGICVCLGMPVQGTRREKVACIRLYLTHAASLRRTIETLRSECREALEYMLQQDGRVKYGEFSRRFGDAEGDSWWWDKKPPHSTLGQLRSRGLVFVGKTPIAGRLCKVAIIPQELCGLVVDALSGSKPTQPAKQPAEAQGAKFYRTLGAQLGALKFHYAIFATEDEDLKKYYQRFMSYFQKTERVRFGGADGFAEEEYLWNFRLPGTGKFLIDCYLERHGKPKSFTDRMLNWRGAKLRYCKILAAKELLLIEDLETGKRMACLCLNIGGVREYRRSVGDAVIGYVSPWGEGTHCLMGYSITVPIIRATLVFCQALKQTLQEVTARTQEYLARPAKRAKAEPNEVPEAFRKAFEE